MLHRHTAYNLPACCLTHTSASFKEKNCISMHILTLIMPEKTKQCDPVSVSEPPDVFRTCIMFKAELWVVGLVITKCLMQKMNGGKRKKRKKKSGLRRKWVSGNGITTTLTTGCWGFSRSLIIRVFIHTLDCQMRFSGTATMCRRKWIYPKIEK